MKIIKITKIVEETGRRFLKASLILLCAGLSVLSCREEYDKHYDPDLSQVEASTLMELIDSRPELSSFAGLLHATGYDTLLRSSQSYTVFAPVNQALQDINIAADERLALRIVKNHIARFTHSASGSLADDVYMLSGKSFPFGTGGNSYQLGNSYLMELNHVTGNGVLHTLDRIIPYVPNLWESLDEQGFDSIRNYLYSFSKNEFIPSRSTAIDIDAEGRIVYDSVFDISNIMWNVRGKGIGYLNREDSIYTMILPTNEAWREAYNRITPYFRSSTEIGDSLQRVNTQYAIVKDLVFRDLPGRPAWPSLDSLISTRGGIFYQPDYLLEGAVKTEASNGTVYRTNQLMNKPWESWNPTVRIEAETTLGRENDDRSTIQVHSAMNHPEISEYRFISVYPLASSDRPYIQFELPGVLAGAYNIYCVFVPETVLSPNSTKDERTRVRFTIYNYRDGRWISIASGGNQGGQITPADNTTSSTGLTKMLVYPNFVFPYANLGEKESTLRLRVTCSVTAAEISRGYSNTMRIDCLLLEPVH